jgi:hypothetical protein
LPLTRSGDLDHHRARASDPSRWHSLATGRKGAGPVAHLITENRAVGGQADDFSSAIGDPALPKKSTSSRGYDYMLAG